MTIPEALILGIVQGLTEFLPVSSSGHLELGRYFLNTSSKENLLFAILVHGATALSTLVVFRKDVKDLVNDVFRWRWNPGTEYVAKLALSMIPVALVGLLFESEIEALFTGNATFVSLMLLITGSLLLVTRFVRNPKGNITYPKSLLIGIAQAVAILPGISRSGATISTSLILGVERTAATRFSFLMVLAPILGAMILKTSEIVSHPELINKDQFPALIVGFLASFISGLVACRWMIAVVRKGNLMYFAIYCFVVATAVLLFSIF